MTDFKTITRKELKRWMDEKKDFVLIDVLPEASFNQKHIPGSKNIDVRDPKFIEKIAKLVTDKEKPIVVYCSSFTCQLSPLAASKLHREGYNVYDFEGGLADWMNGGYNMEGEDYN